MAAYLDKAKKQLRSFPAASIEVIPQSRNSNTDALAKIASTKDADQLDAVSVEFLAEPSIHPQQGVMELTQEPSWMDPSSHILKLASSPRTR